MNKMKLSDDDFLNVVREVRSWKERDSQKYLTFQNRVKQIEKKKRIRLSIIIVSAVAALVLFMIYLPWKCEVSKNSSELFNQFYEPYQFATDYRSGSVNSSDDTFKQALKAYNSNDWSVAERLCDSLQKFDNDNPDYLLLIGLTKLMSGRLDIAEQKFDSLISVGGSFSLHARWYLSLTFLKQNRIEECRKELVALKNPGSSYYKAKASSLLRSLE